MESKYAIELISPSGLLLADLTGRADGRRITKSRNEPDEITWTLDLNEFERYCRRNNVDPKTLLIAGQTEVRVRRGLNYIAAGQVVYHRTTLNSHQQQIEIRATGFLNLFKDRFVGARTFTATQATTIAQTLITESQAVGSDWNFGVTIGPNQATVGTHDRTYGVTSNLKDALQNLTRVQVAPFDFEFTYDKKFNTYAMLGSNRPDLIFEYPHNIKSLSVPKDATSMANQVIGLGSGFGALSTTTYTGNDTAAQSNYKVRQKVIQSNATDNSDNGLTDAVNAELAAWRDPFEVPDFEIDGNVAPFVGDYGIGDRVTFRVLGHRFLSHLDLTVRLEKFDLTIDKNDNEVVRPKVSLV